MSSPQRPDLPSPVDDPADAAVEVTVDDTEQVVPPARQPGQATETAQEATTNLSTDTAVEPQADSEAVAAVESVQTFARSGRWSDRDRERERDLLRVLADSEPDAPVRRAARDELVTMHLPLVEYLARRFRDRGESHDDLVQVGTIGLIKSVDRFDTTRGVEFSTYATPTIVGEIKRHFRDRGWAIRVPRRLQEMRLHLNRATGDLTHALGRSPTVRELAQHIGVSDEEILEGLESAQAYATTSLDAGSDEDGAAPSIVDTMGSDDAALEQVEYRESLRPLLAALPERERRIIMLRFFHSKTQSQIAEEIGISQMHVSRLLARSLGQLRTGLAQD